jgi:hypothetical protein
VQSTAEVPAGTAVGLVLGATSFYAEAGGQTADTGAIAAASATFDVEVRRGGGMGDGTALAGHAAAVAGGDLCGATAPLIFELFDLRRACCKRPCPFGGVPLEVLANPF